MNVDIYIGYMHLSVAQHATELDLIVNHDFYMVNFFLCLCWNVLIMGAQWMVMSPSEAWQGLLTGTLHYGLRESVHSVLSTPTDTWCSQWY